MWQPALTQLEKRQIERVQKCALCIILREGYTDYNNALTPISCDNFNTRRVKFCEKFAKKAVNNTRYSNWFIMSNSPPSTIYTRQDKKQPKYKQVQKRTDRFQKSPIPHTWLSY